jgi:hypothetical protein
MATTMASGGVRPVLTQRELWQRVPRVPSPPLAFQAGCTPLADSDGAVTHVDRAVDRPNHGPRPVHDTRGSPASPAVRRMRRPSL